MESNKYIITIYEQVNGNKPFEIWLKNIKDPLTRARIRARIDKIETGNLGDCKTIGSGIFELKFSFGAGIRIYFGQKNSLIIILLIGGDKSSQNHDIKKATQFWIDYKERNNE